MSMSDLRTVEKLRTRSGKADTAATVILAVGKPGVKVEAFDHFDGKTVRVGVKTIPA